MSSCEKRPMLYEIWLPWKHTLFLLVHFGDWIVLKGIFVRNI